MREDFEILKEDIIYLDSASTTLKPRSITSNINKIINKYPLTINRSNSKYSRELESMISNVRVKVSKFINSDNNNNIYFTDSATSSSKIIANILLKNISEKDEIMLSKTDHLSTIKPYIYIYTDKVKIVEIKVDEAGYYSNRDILNKVNSNTYAIVLTHIHNIYGVKKDIKELVIDIKKINPNTIIVVDASQSIGHINVDVVDMNVDYLYFSAHKMLGLNGTGILYKKDNKEMDIEDSTLNIVSILSLGDAIDYINNIKIENIENTISNLTRYLYNELLQFDDIIFNKGIHYCNCQIGYGILSFKFRDVALRDLSDILDTYNIIIRSNNNCNDVENDFIRVSLYVYNTKEDIDKFIKVIKHIKSNMV